MNRLYRIIADLLKTTASLIKASWYWCLIRTPVGKFFQNIKKDEFRFAFLVHPRTQNLEGIDTYGANDIYRPYPFFQYLFPLLGSKLAKNLITGYAKHVVPIKLSSIKVRFKSHIIRGYLLSTVRPPEELFRGRNTKHHLQDLFLLATRLGSDRVGLGALIPALTRYGRDFIKEDDKTRPAVSTGHAYTGYVITEFIKRLIEQRGGNTRLAIVGAAGSTGVAVSRMLKINPSLPKGSQITLIDLPAKNSKLLEIGTYLSEAGYQVKTCHELTALLEVDYVVVVTSARGVLIRPEHIRPGVVIIDDTQPRNTSPELVTAGAYVVDVLARINGLDCGFDFGFKPLNPNDTSVTFTCLAETILASAAEYRRNLAVGEIDELVAELTMDLVAHGNYLGLIGELPFYSFGREMTEEERMALFSNVPAQVIDAAQ